MRNIPIPSRKYLIEKAMVNPIRTEIPSSDLENFEYFLSANGLDNVKIGFHSFMKYKKNLICIEIPDDEQSQASATYLSLKYGSIEKAYRQYRDNLENMILGSTISHGY